MDRISKLTIGMATYEDYDGVYFTLQAIRIYHAHLLDRIEFLVLDNAPAGAAGRAVADLVHHIPNLSYFPFKDYNSTASRDWIFRKAQTEWVLCLDAHVFLLPGVLEQLLLYMDQHPDSIDLLQGPLVYDDLKHFSTHFEPRWQQGMYGVWATDERGASPTAPPFEIPMQGLGLFACRKIAWPGLNPRFRGFGGEEGYLHEKFRQAGGRVWCLPFLRWVHRFNRPNGAPYPNLWEDRMQNYLLGWQEIAWELKPLIDHFNEVLGENGPPLWTKIYQKMAHAALLFDALYWISPVEGDDLTQKQLAQLGLAFWLRVRHPEAQTDEKVWSDILAEAQTAKFKRILIFKGAFLLKEDFLQGLKKTLQGVDSNWSVINFSQYLVPKSTTDAQVVAIQAPAYGSYLTNLE